MLSALAMVIAVGVTLATSEINDFRWIIGGVVVGAVIGTVAAQMVHMTAMPQMVALFNGFGGAASALVAISEFKQQYATLDPFLTSVMMVSLLVGAVTLTGSLVAFGKLQELVTGRAVVFPGQHLLNLVLGVGAIVLGVLVVLDPGVTNAVIGVGVIALLLGILLVIPIGGADMPAVSFTGFVLSNNALIIVGSLVGASGIFLTNAMCVAMNRSIWNVLFGGFGATSSGPAAAADPSGGAVKPYTVEDAATIMENATSMIIVPGYGMAAAQAQHAVRELADALETLGVEVRYAIHPVAGRMPGHMNVLLAESNVPYDQLFDMDDINDDFSDTDVALVIGANDVVNPAANEDPSSPIYGMPILNVEQARTVMVLKRSMNPGFAGIDNALFLRDNTMMIFGDAKDTLNKMVNTLGH